MNLISAQDLGSIIPELVLTATLIVGLILDLAVRDKTGRNVAGVSILGLVAALMIGTFLTSADSLSLFGGMISRDAFAVMLQMITALAALLTVIISVWSSEISDKPTAGRGEYYLLILGATIGMFFLVGSTNLLMLYLSMELLSFPSYLLVGWMKRESRSKEAAIKYLVYGAAASCSMIYGISLLYGLTGSLQFSGIADYVAGLSSKPDLPTGALMLALLFTFAGFFFKIAAFPLFQWAPDVYEGAPTPITAFLAVGSKAAGMGALLRFIYTALSSTGVVGETFTALGGMNVPLFFAVVSALTMTVGNFIALAQKNAKRMLAYSSIAHAGYMLMGVPVMSVLGLQAILFYLVVYLIMNLGAFLSIIMLENRGIEPEILAYKGLGARAPGIAIPFSIFLFSLTGVPPFAGFIGKVYLFAALIKGGMFWLAIIGVLNSVVSLYYYLGIVKQMYFARAYDESPLPPVEVLRSVLWVLVVPTLLLGVYWKPAMQIASVAAFSLGLK